jgi:hypothetical protein
MSEKCPMCKGSSKKPKWIRRFISIERLIDWCLMCECEGEVTRESCPFTWPKCPCDHPTPNCNQEGSFYQPASILE